MVVVHVHIGESAPQWLAGKYGVEKLRITPTKENTFVRSKPFLSRLPIIKQLCNILNCLIIGMRKSSDRQRAGVKRALRAANPKSRKGPWIIVKSVTAFWEEWLEFPQSNW